MKNNDLHLLQEAYSRLYTQPDDEEQYDVDEETLLHTVMHDDLFLRDLEKLQNQHGRGHEIPPDEIQIAGSDNGYDISAYIATMINTLLADPDDLDGYNIKDRDLN
mgnify:CR=1 FL=1